MIFGVELKSRVWAGDEARRISRSEARMCTCSESRFSSRSLGRCRRIIVVANSRPQHPTARFFFLSSFFPVRRYAPVRHTPTHFHLLVSFSPARDEKIWLGLYLNPFSVYRNYVHVRKRMHVNTHIKNLEGCLRMPLRDIHGSNVR